VDGADCTHLCGEREKRVHVSDVPQSRQPKSDHENENGRSCWCCLGGTWLTYPRRRFPSPSKHTLLQCPSHIEYPAISIPVFSGHPLSHRQLSIPPPRLTKTWPQASSRISSARTQVGTEIAWQNENPKGGMEHHSFFRHRLSQSTLLTT
jgi:hypothetical protein